MSKYLKELEVLETKVNMIMKDLPLVDDSTGKEIYGHILEMYTMIGDVKLYVKDIEAVRLGNYEAYTSPTIIEFHMTAEIETLLKDIENTIGICIKLAV